MESDVAAIFLPSHDGRMPMENFDFLFEAPSLLYAITSRCGRRVAWVRPTLNGHEITVMDLSIEQSTAYEISGAMPLSLTFSYCGNHLFFSQDDRGNELYTLNSISLRDKTITSILPPCSNQWIVWQTQSHVFISANLRDPAINDLLSLDISTKNISTIHHGSSLTIDYRVSPDGNSFFCLETSATSSSTAPLSRIHVYCNGIYNNSIDLEAVIGRNSYILHIDDHNHIIIMNESSAGTSFFKMSADTGEFHLLFSSSHSIKVAIIDRVNNAIVAGVIEHTHPEWLIFSDQHRKLIEACHASAGPGFYLHSASRSLNTLIVQSTEPTRIPATFVIFSDDQEFKAINLSTFGDIVSNFQPFPMEIIDIPTADNLRLVGYLTRASHKGLPHRPLILMVHGGPHDAREHYTYRHDHQYLAANGFSVLSVNFRGSSGFGDAFEEAGYREWGGAMQQDLYTSIEWAIENGHAEAGQVGIMGISYGGYATLMAASGCVHVSAAVAINPVVDLVNHLEMGNTPAHWAPFADWLKMTIGDISDPTARQQLVDRSPITHVHKINIPLLIIHGVNDARISGDTVKRYADCAATNDCIFRYIPLDEGHFISTIPGKKLLYRESVQFFKQHLIGMN